MCLSWTYSKISASISASVLVAVAGVATIAKLVDATAVGCSAVCVAASVELVDATALGCGAGGFRVAFGAHAETTKMIIAISRKLRMDFM